jgi:hypothetical protein
MLKITVSIDNLLTALPSQGSRKRRNHSTESRRQCYYGGLARLTSRVALRNLADVVRLLHRPTLILG